MTIRIASRIHPLSHLPGTMCLLPQTHLKVQIFPSRILFFNFTDPLPLFSLSLDIQGPIKEFTIEMDLEHQQIKIFGMTRVGYLRYILQRQSDGISMTMEKTPQERIICHISHVHQACPLLRGETLLIPHLFIEQPPPLLSERLSLGMHKKQDWDLIKRRCDPKEIFPIWMRLGQCIPSLSSSFSIKGNLSLLQQCEEIIKENRKQEILPAFQLLFLTAFEGMLVPRLFDADYQGVAPIEIPLATDPSPIPILSQGALLIRSLFLREEEGVLFLLPSLPPDFHAGRMLEAHTLSGDRVDFEWTKKQLRRVILYPHSEKKRHFAFSRHIRKCRVRRSLKDKGQEYEIKEGRLFLDLALTHPIFLDRFQK